MLDPIELFTKLDKSKSEIEVLRLVQQEILEQYYNTYKQKSRIGIKLPTGSGKSLIAILILDAWRQSGKTVAILTANKALAEDMQKRCDEISIPSATIFGSRGSDAYKRKRTRDLRKYKQKRIIGIFNYHSYLYGTEYRQEISPPDVLIIDDASDFTILRNDYFTISINRKYNEKEYIKIIESLDQHDKLYSQLSSFKEKTATSDDVELIYYIHNELIHKEIRNNISSLRKNDNFSFSWDRNKDLISSFVTFITQNSIELKPLLIPENSLKMGNVKHIIFISATLPDDELLNKTFGILKDPIVVLDENDVSKKAFEEISTSGKRIIFPLDQTDLRRGLGDKCKSIILDLVSRHKKLLVLTNSNHDAESLQKYLLSHQINALTFTDDTYELFSRETQGVLICANRYFGLDFPGDSCKIEVITRLPAIWDNIDAFQFNVLNNTRYIEQTIGYRLTQALGRCNRLLTDEAQYYILDSRIISRITGEEQYLKYLPRNIYAELITGYDISQGGIIEKAIDYGSNHFFNHDDPEYNELLKDELEAWEPGSKKIFESKYNLEIEAWEKSLKRSFSYSGDLFNYVAQHYHDSVDAVTDQNLDLLAAFSYYLSSQNYYNGYLFYNDEAQKGKCLTQLKKAIEYGGSTSWFNGLSAIFNSLSDSEQLTFDENRIEVRQVKEEIARKFADFIHTKTRKNQNWKVYFSNLIQLVSGGSHGAMLNALSEFFRILGYSTLKGNNQKGEPDLLIKVAYYQVPIEVKTKQGTSKEGVDSVTEALGDGLVQGRLEPNKRTHVVLLTQKDEFTTKAIEVGIEQVKLISTSIFVNIMKAVYDQIEVWESLTPTEQTSYTDKIISPYELEDIFVSGKNPYVDERSIKTHYMISTHLLFSLHAPYNPHFHIFHALLSALGIRILNSIASSSW